MEEPKNYSTGLGSSFLCASAGRGKNNTKFIYGAGPTRCIPEQLSPSFRQGSPRSYFTPPLTHRGASALTRASTVSVFGDILVAVHIFDSKSTACRFLQLVSDQ